MPSRRGQVQDAYRRLRTGSVLLEKSAAAANRSIFHGAKIARSVIVRADLNGYSSWAETRRIEERAALLDHFFTESVGALDDFAGVYFRDEGDCVVAVFSDYFGGINYASVLSYCKGVVGKRFGKDGLSAKAIVACGNVGFYQKQHEIPEDWSAEGDPFVRAARLEAAVESKPRI